MRGEVVRSTGGMSEGESRLPESWDDTAAGSIMSRLRAITPVRGLTRAEMMHAAEMQTQTLLDAAGASGPPTPDDIIESLPRVVVHREIRIGVAGLSDWANGRWIIAIRPQDQ